MNLEIEKQVFFVGEKLPMTVRAINELYAVCTRPLNKEHDLKLLEFEVERGAYMSVDEAYYKLMDEVVYTCLDFKAQEKAPHNLVFNLYSFDDQESFNELLNDLTTGSVELSQKRKANFKIDFERMK